MLLVVVVLVVVVAGFWWGVNGSDPVLVGPPPVTVLGNGDVSGPYAVLFCLCVWDGV